MSTRSDNSMWEKSMLTLKDSVFFHIVKNYLGKLETPFNKHSLIRKLKKFLSGESTVERIISLLDIRDKRVLSSIYRLSFPHKNSLYDHLCDYLSFTEFHFALQNLEERLLVYEYEDRYFINPLLLKDIEHSILSTNWNVESREASPAEAPHQWLSELRLFCVLGYLFHHPECFGRNGMLKPKHVTEIHNRTMPGSEQKNESGSLSRAAILVSCLFRLGFAVSEDMDFSVRIERIREFCRLSFHERFFYILSAYMISIIEYEGHTPPLLTPTATVLASFIKSLPLNREFTKSSLHTVLCEIDSSLSHSTRDLILNELSKLHILHENSGWFSLASSLTKTDDKEGSIVFHSSLQFTLNSNYSCEALVLSILSADLVEVDYYARFDITRKTIFSAKGFFSDEIPDLYTRYSLSLPQSTAFTLRQWYNQADDIHVFHGVVLEIDTRIIHDFEAACATLPVHKITEGVYVISSGYFGTLCSILEQKGIHVPATSAREENVSILSDRTRRFEAIKTGQTEIHTGREDEKDQSKPSFLDNIYTVLSRSGFSKSEREEIDERIKSKLILHETQISREICRKDKSDARGIDYQGKVNLIQQAIGTGEDFIMAQMYDDNFEQKEYLLLPLRLVKNDREHTLEAKTLPEEADFVAKVGQLARVRRIRKSLY